MKDGNIAWLFDPEPEQWPLRGDPHLWREMREKCKDIAEIKNTEELKERIYSLFYELTDHQLYEGEIIYVRKYNPGHGMSAGMVTMTWWVLAAIPLLMLRFNDDESPSHREKSFYEAAQELVDMKGRHESHPAIPQE
jgi:hypothetical protein